jgi:putative membrane protein
VSGPEPSVLPEDPLPDGITAEESAAIRRAVEEAERRTGGEIVALALTTADEYQVAFWKGAALAGLAAAALAAVVDQLRPLWLSRPTWMLLVVACGMLAGCLAVRTVPPLRRWLCGRQLLERRLQLRAREAFLLHEVWKTRDRTGILVAVSGFEHQVVVLADEGIHKVVPAGTWERLARETAATVRESGLGAGLLAAVGKADGILTAHGLTRRPDDRNELPDAVRGEFR